MQSAGHDMNQNMSKYVSNINETDAFIFRMKKCFKMTSFATQKMSWDDTELRQLKVHRPANCANCANCAEGCQLRLLLTLPDQVLSTLPNLWMFRAVSTWVSITFGNVSEWCPDKPQLVMIPQLVSLMPPWVSQLSQLSQLCLKTGQRLLLCTPANPTSQDHKKNFK